MSLRLIHRAARLYPERPSSLTFTAPPAPPNPRKEGFKLSALVTPIMGGAGFMVYGLLAPSGASRFFTIGLAFIGVALVLGLVYRWLADREASKEAEANLLEYRADLDRLNSEIAEAKTMVLQYRAHVHPSPDQITTVAEGPRLWERRIGDSDFLSFGVGIGTVPTGIVVDSQRPGREFPAQARSQLEAVCHSATILRGGIVEASFRDTPVVSLVGPSGLTRSLALAVLNELAFSCGPDELQIVLLAPPARLAEWRCMGELPHLRGQAPGNIHAYSDLDEFDASIGDLVRPRLTETRTGPGPGTRWSEILLVIDDFDPEAQGLQGSAVIAGVLSKNAAIGFSVLATCSARHNVPESTSLVIELGEQPSLMSAGTDGLGTQRVAIEQVWEASTELTAELARHLGECQLAAAAARVAAARSDRLLDVDRSPENYGRELLSFVIGIDDHGRDLALDIKESAYGGDGPHGLIVGATGSGKSEMLRTIALSAALTHSPSELAMMLIDFKGGATFDPLRGIPHCVGLITNLEGEDYLIDRMRDSIIGEMHDRQRAFAAQQVPNIQAYTKLRETRSELDAIPHLFVIADEVGELLSAREDFFEVFVQIARVGRALGVHLLLATQRLEGRMPALCSHLSYRLCLKTFTTEDSLVVLGSKIAADIDTGPGRGYLKSSAGVQGFRSLRVDQEHRSQESGWTTDDLGNATSDFEVTARRLSESEIPRARQLWRPPLPDPTGDDCLRLESLVTDLDAELKMTEIPLGRRDEPLSCDQPLLTYDMGGSGGHLLILGAPRSGKTWALRSVIESASHYMDAGQLRVLALDFGGGELRAAGYSHVAADALADDASMIDRILAELKVIVNSPVEAQVHCLLVVDDVGMMRSRHPEFDDVMPEVLALGQSKKLHVVMTAGRLQDVPSAWHERIGQRVELRLIEPMLSTVDRHLASAVPKGLPGRGLVPPGRMVQLAACSSGEASAPTRRVTQLVTAECIRPEEFERAVHECRNVAPVIGVSEVSLEAVPLMLDRHNPLHIVGSPEQYGLLLSRLTRELTTLHASKTLDFFCVDLGDRKVAEGPAGRLAQTPAAAEALLNQMLLQLMAWFEKSGNDTLAAPPRTVLVVNGFEVLHELDLEAVREVEIGDTRRSYSQDLKAELGKLLGIGRFLGLRVVLAQPAEGYGQRMSSPIYVAADKLAPDWLMCGGSSGVVGPLVGLPRKRSTELHTAYLMNRGGLDMRVRISTE